MRSDTEDIRRQPRARTRTTATTSVEVDTEDTDKDTDKVTDKFAIVSSGFVRLRTCFGEQYLSDVVEEESGQPAVIGAFLTIESSRLVIRIL